MTKSEWQMMKWSKRTYRPRVNIQQFIKKIQGSFSEPKNKNKTKTKIENMIKNSLVKLYCEVTFTQQK